MPRDRTDRHSFTGKLLAHTDRNGSSLSINGNTTLMASAIDLCTACRMHELGNGVSFTLFHCLRSVFVTEDYKCWTNEGFSCSYVCFQKVLGHTTNRIYSLFAEY